MIREAEVLEIISQPPDPRPELIKDTALTPLNTAIRTPLMRVVAKKPRMMGSHFYILPVLRIAGCRSLLTLDTPCSICGMPCSSDVHNTVGGI